MLPFSEIRILHRFIVSAMCYICHCLYGTHETFKLTSSASNFIFAMVIKVRVKPSVFASKFYHFDIGHLLHLKHNTIWTLLLGTLQRFNGHPRLVTAPFWLLKVIVAAAINR